MRIAFGLGCFLWIGAVSPVLAADPPAPPPPSAAQTEQTAPTASSSTPATAATSAKSPVVTEAKADDVSADGVSKEELKRLHAAGYKQKTRGGQLVYCRVEPVLGTRFDKEMCGTAVDLALVRANGQEMASQMQKTWALPKVLPGFQ